MGHLQTGTAISKSMGISNRMLRYYEQIGLIESQRIDGYAYRVYDECMVHRLQQIIILRKLRIPVKQINSILMNDNGASIMNVFQCNISALDEEITALSTIRSLLKKLVSELEEKVNIQIKLDWLESSSALASMQVLDLPKNTLQEGTSMNELSKANERLNHLEDKDVRIVYLPPATVAAVRCVGDAPEERTGKLLFEFIKEHKLPAIKPDFRHYGFNAPDGEPPHSGDDHGYERWVTIPEDMDLSNGFVKKHFPGGLYCAHMIPMGAFEEWQLLFDWANRHEKYEIVWGDSECMNGCLEEHLDVMHHHLWSGEELDRRLQLDLLIPIRERS